MKNPIKRIFCLVMTVAVVLWGSGLAMLLPANAAVTATAPQDYTGGQGKTSPAVPIKAVIVGLSSTASETLNSVTFTITQTGGTVTSDDFASVKLYRDSNDGANDVLDPATDTLVHTMTTGINVGSASTMTISTPDAIPTTVGGTWNYVLVLTPSGTASNGDTFTVGLASGTGAFVLSAGTVTTSALTTANIVVDLTAPQAIADGSAGAGGPANLQANVPVEAFIDRGFSERLDLTTVNTTNVTLKTNTGNAQDGAPTGTNLCAQVFFDMANNKIVCEHMSDATPLSASTWYTLTITTGVKDVAGNALASNFTRQFQTGSFVGGNQFKPLPFVQGTMPPRGGQLPTNGKLIAFFSQVMNSNSGDGKVLDINNVQLFALNSTNAVTGSNLFLNTTGWTWDATKRELRIPAPTLTAGNKYRFIINADNNTDPGDGSCGGTSEPTCVMSTDNLALQGDQRIDFTAVASDSSAPTVIGSFPANATTGVDRAISDITVSMNEFIDPTSVTTTNVKLIEDLNTNNLPDDVAISNVMVHMESDGRVIKLSPQGLLTASKKHFIVLVSGATGIKDGVGTILPSDINLSFTTGANINGGASDTAEPKVEFADADNQGIFITFNEALKFNQTTNATKTSSTGANDVNNATLFIVEISADSGTTWSPVALTTQDGTLLTGKTIDFEPFSKTLKIQGISLTPTNLFKVTASTSIQDLSGNGMSSSNRIAQGTVKNAQQTGGNLGIGQGGTQGGGPNFFQMGTNPINVFPQNAQAGATSRYKVEFKSDTAVAGSGLIKLTFPSGFSFDTTNADATKRCTALPTDIFDNNDINGPATGTVTIASVACDTVSRVVTLTLGATGISANDFLRFTVQGVVNSTVPKDFSTSGYSVDIKTYASGVLKGTYAPKPFFLSTAGSRTVSGTIFLDNGAGGGTANNKTKEAGESGVASIQVCMHGPMGGSCTQSDNNGDYSFTQLNDGFYNLNAMISGSYTGGPFFRDVNVASANVTGVNFGLQQASAQNTLNIRVNATGLDGKKLDVFAFQGGTSDSLSGPSGGGFVVKTCTVGTDCNSIDLGLTPGKWEIGVGPEINKTPGTIPTMPEFNFMPPRPQQIYVDGTTGVADTCEGAGNPDLCLTIETVTHTISGKVVNGSGSAIQNVFMNARPSNVEATNGPAMASVAQTNSTGNFSLKVKPNVTYLVEGFMPGMGHTKPFECTVKADTSNSATDNNSTADVYCNGVLIVNDITNFASGSSVTVANITSNDLINVIDQGSTSVSGKVLDDSSNPLALAHVSAQEVDSSGNPQGGWADAQTDSSGNYTFYVKGGTEEAPKKWKVRAFAPGFGELAPITVSVVEGENATDKNLQPQSGQFFTVSGQLTQGASGVDGAHIHAFGPCGGNGTITDTSGNYTLKLRATGSCTTDSSDTEDYKIQGFKPGVGPTNEITTAVTANATGKNLTIGQSGTIVAYVCTITTPGSAPSITNKCVSNQITTAFVDARDSTGKGYGTRANTTSGQYELTLPAGTYTVKAGDAKIGNIGSSSSVVVTAGQSTYINITPPTLSTVSGTLASSATSCIEGSTVSLKDTTNGRIVLAPVASNGTYSVTNVANGTYTVNVGKPGCVDNADAGTITVNGSNLDQSADADLARTVIQSNMVVTGQVSLNGSNTTQDTVVFATSSGGKTVVAEIDTTKTGSNDNYTLNLTTGTTWTIKARSDGSESTAINVTSATSSADLTLSAISGYTRKEPKTSNITPSLGGLVKNTDIGEKFELNFPAGSLGTSSSDGGVSVKETTSAPDVSGSTLLGKKAIEITPKDPSGQPISTLSSSSGSLPTITIPYTEADVTSASGDESKLVIGAWSEEKGSWEPMPTTCDTTANTCTATVSHFSTFGTLSTSTSSSSSSGGSSTDIKPATDLKLTTDGNKVTATWKDPSSNSVNKIEILRNDGAGTPVSNTPVAQVTKGVQTYIDSNVITGKEYTYRIRSRDTNGNQRLTDEIKITVVAPVVTNPTSSGGGGGGASNSNNSSTNTTTIPTSTTNQTPTTTPTTTPTNTAPTNNTTTKLPIAPVTEKPKDYVVKSVPTQPVQSVLRKNQIEMITEDAGVVGKASVEKVLSHIKKVRNLKNESSALSIMNKALNGKLPTNANVKESFKNFIAYGTPTTDKLGSGERAGVVNSYKSAFGKLPETDTDWEDVIKISNGRWPSKRSTLAEETSKTSFESIYKRKPDMNNTNDNAAVTIMAYGLRSDNRNFASEKNAIKMYKEIFKRVPETATAWDAVRAISYSGAKR